MGLSLVLVTRDAGKVGGQHREVEAWPRPVLDPYILDNCGLGQASLCLRVLRPPSPTRLVQRANQDVRMPFPSPKFFQRK
jgi:hypothetical protein